MKTRRTVRTVVGAVVAAGAAAALLWAFRPQAVPADFTTIARGPLAVTVEGEAVTRVREVFTVSMPVLGRLRRIEVEVGDEVVADATEIVRIDPILPTILDARARRELEAAVETATAAQALAAAELERVEAELAFTRSDWTRAQRLFERGTISEATRDRAELDLQRQQAAVREAQAAVRMRDFELESARARLMDPLGELTAGEGCCLTVTAPISGQVLQVFQESAAVVRAGEPIIAIGDPRDLEVVADLLSSDAVRVEPGDPVRFEDWGGEEPLAGVVRRVEPFGFTEVSALGIEEQRVNVVIDFTSPRVDWQRLGHGYRLDAVIEVWRGENVVTVPLSALFRVGGAWHVFRVVGGRAVLTAVDIGRRNDAAAAVSGGLSAGDVVLLYPSDRIEDGSRVTPRAG